MYLLKQIRIIILLMLMGMSYACSMAINSPVARNLENKPTDTIKYAMGNQQLKFIVYHSSDSTGIVYFNMHDNENTAVEAAKYLVDTLSGKFIELCAQGVRLVSFKIDSIGYQFDPNRIYTDSGIIKTLKKYGNYSEKAFNEVKLFSDFITKKLLADANVIVAVHNNSNGYSINDYKKGGVYQTDAEKLYFNENQCPNDFFYVIESKHFDDLKSKQLNVVLQNNNSVTDDGSLSVFCSKNNKTYINVEAKIGHLNEQKEMLNTIHSYLVK